MRTVGLTGVIGAGKSTVARMLADLGAVVLDADTVAHSLYEPGTAVHRAIVDEFGREVLAEGGTIARPRLGAVVFSDPARLAALNAITHPPLYARMAELSRGAPDDAIVVWDMAILNDRDHTDRVIVVAAHEDATIAHLGRRGMPEDEARRRMANQPPVAEKVKLADWVIWNDGTLSELEKQVDEVWAELRSR